jgi:hypothetical protein
MPGWLMHRFPPHAVALSFLCAPLVALVPLASLGHPGGLDHDGGHIDKKTGQYHLHRLDYSAEAKSRSAGGITSSKRSAPRASAPEHYLAGVGQIPTDLLTTPAPSVNRTQAKAQPPAKPATPPTQSTPAKDGLRMAKTGWALPANKETKTIPTLTLPTTLTGYAREHSLKLRAFHDKQGEFIGIGEVSATSPATATIVLASGEEKTIDFAKLCYADRTFIAAQQDRAASGLADELARDHGYRLWRIDKTQSTLKAKVIAYDGKSASLKAKTPEVTTHLVADLHPDDRAHLESLANLLTRNTTALAKAAPLPGQ